MIGCVPKLSDRVEAPVLRVQDVNAGDETVPTVLVGHTVATTSPAGLHWITASPGMSVPNTAALAGLGCREQRTTTKTNIDFTQSSEKKPTKELGSGQLR